MAVPHGGFVGLGYAPREPSRVRRLAILNSRAHRTFPLGFYLTTLLLSAASRMPGLRAMLVRVGIGDLHRRDLRRYIRRGCFDEELMERYIGWMDSPEGRRWFGHFYAHYDVRPRADLRAGLDQLRIPVAVSWGDRDPYCPFAIAEDLARRVPMAVLTRIAGADHFVVEERPAEVLSALQALLAR